MKTEEVLLLRKSFAFVEEHSHIMALSFYRRLFELDPSLRPLFRSDIEAQAGKLIDMLGAAISLLDRPEAFQAELEQLGARHVGYGVREEHYDTVGRALLETLAEVFGARFTVPVRNAWTELYGRISAAMLHGAAKAGDRSAPVTGLDD